MRSVLSVGRLVSAWWRRPCSSSRPLTLHVYSAQAQVEAVEARKERLAAQEAAQQTREGEARRLGESIVELREALTGRAFDPGFRETVKRNLQGVPIDTLRDVERNGAQGDLRAAISALGETDSTSAGAEEDLLLLPTRVAEPNAVSGVATSGAVFVPLNPCRIIDTRLAGGPLFPGVPRSFVVSGSNAALFGAQGGNPSGCGIPVGTAVAAFVNFVAASPAGAGNLRAWAYAASLHRRRSPRSSTTRRSSAASRTGSRRRCVTRRDHLHVRRARPGVRQLHRRRRGRPGLLPSRRRRASWPQPGPPARRRSGPRAPTTGAR